ncbi:MAG TPA: nuclear transport factor 2 family protein [Solirubrobacteraceae bacterium]|jgi:ketosteroid isomerase-like protein|nr:nuclear transport factor 2 family protein [Solirubrobacteraceae bacterium]
MSEESTIPDLVELEALYRTALPDGTDVAHVAHDDAAWATLSRASAALYAPDFVYEDSVVPDHRGDAYRGFEGYRRAVATFTEPFEEMIYDLERLAACGDRVVAIYRVRATARHTGLRFDQQAAYVLSFRGGMISHVRAYRDPDEALKAAWRAD